MLTRRIIPCLDVEGGKVVKGKKFKNIKQIDDPVKLAKFYSQCGADELVFYDITASHEKRKIMLEIVEKTAEKVFIPFTVGGGINSIDDFNDILKAGGDKVSVNSAAVKNPNLIKEAALKFGSQCVVLSIDVKRVDGQNTWNVYINGGRINTGLDVVEWTKKGVMLGAGEIVINSIDDDGVQGGYDLELMKIITSEVNVPVIASGGAGNMEDFYEVFKHGDVDGALAASVFHYRKIEIKQLKKYLMEMGISIRKG